MPPHQLGPGVVPVVSPDIPDMPWRLENGVKVFDIRVEHVRTEFDSRSRHGWLGVQRQHPGPTIQVNEGDRVRLNVENRLPEPFSMHWHGLEIPIEMDGMPGISQDAILPGGRFVYEFTLKQNGTFFYHSHMADAGDDGPDRPLHHPSAPRAHAARRSRLRHHPPGMGAAPEQHDPQLAGHGVQLADDEREGRTGDDPADRASSGNASASAW